MLGAELNEYMKVVANIEMKRQVLESNKDASLTLNKLLLLIYDQFQKLKTIYLIVDSCRSIFNSRLHRVLPAKCYLQLLQMLNSVATENCIQLLGAYVSAADGNDSGMGHIWRAKRE